MLIKVKLTKMIDIYIIFNYTYAWFIDSGWKDYQELDITSLIMYLTYRKTKYANVDNNILISWPKRSITWLISHLASREKE